LVEEGVALRRAGVDAPLLVLSEPPSHQYPDVVRWGLRVTVYTAEAIEGLAATGLTAPDARPIPVHLKVDTGMHRIGARPVDAVALARQIASSPALALDGVMTHLAIADEPDDPYTARQLDAFEGVLRDLRQERIEPSLVHAANSAGAMAHRRGRYSMVRAGIATYGIVPGPGVAHLAVTLRPAMALKSRVSFVKRLSAGERISYELRHRFEHNTTVATVPLGYADGVPRRLSSTGGEVLIGGRRRPITGVVTMDQLMADCGDDAVAPGDEVVLIGVQGDERVTADEWAERLGTIAYEVTCGVNTRVPRVYLKGAGNTDR
jgi:alanine racemase